MTEEIIINQLIDAVNKADSSSALFQAVKNLAQRRSPKAIPTLIEVLGFNNPGAAVTAVDGLIAIGEETVPILLKSLDNYNYGARAWAIRVFAGMGDPIALDLLIQTALTDFSLSVRRSAVKGLGIIKWEKLPPQSQEEAKCQVWKTLLSTVQDEEWVVRYASIVSLQALAKFVDSELQTKIIEELMKIFEKDQEIVIKTRAKLALKEMDISHKA